MAIFETWLKSDIKNMVSVTKLTGNMFSADNNGNLIGVEVMNNGEPAELDGVVTGYVIRPDGGTLIISGTLEENRASIILPASAYVYVGQMSIVIKVGGTTVGACTGYVYRSTTDKIVDPGHVIPSLDELLQKIADCEAATVNANTAATSANNAASLANEKAELANTKAELADEKATLANEKAGLADDAATLANTKALLADEKATLANNKASLADEKAGLANDAAELADANATLAGEKANLANAAAATANTAASKITNMTVSAYGLSPDQSPTVEITEVSGHKHITFGLVKGARGNNGKDFHIRRTFSSIAEMEAYDPDDDHTIYKVEEYDHVMIDTGSVQDPDTGKLYCYEPSTVEVWRYIGDLSGSQGIKGDPGNGISNIVLNQNYTLTITMDDGTTYTTPSVRGPQGETGATGATGETGDTGNGIDHVVLNADYTLTVYFTDSTSYTTDPIRGEQGATGNPGANAYVYIRYAAQQPTQDSDMKTVPDAWMGIYSGTSATAPTTYTSYTWYKIKGETGSASNVYGNTIDMSSTDSTKISDAIAAVDAKIPFVQEPVSGDIATFTDVIGGMPLELTVGIEPVQDLNGYDNPWPGGGGKNKLKVVASTQTVSGVTFTVNSDGTVSANGTASAKIEFNLAWKTTHPLSTGHYILNGCPSGGSTSTYSLAFWQTNYGLKNDVGSGITLDNYDESRDYIVQIIINSGTTVSNLVFKPMLRLDTETDPTFAPYSNICPITGWTGAVVNRTGKNLLKLFDTDSTHRGIPITKENGVVKRVGTWDSTNTTSGFSISGKTISLGNYSNYNITTENNTIKLKPGTYTASAQATKTTGASNLQVFFGVFSSLGGTIANGAGLIENSYGSILGQSKTWTFTLTKEAYFYCGINSGVSSDGTAVDWAIEVQLEAGSSASAFIPYNGNITEYTFPSSAGTVYGGTLTVHQDGTGTLVVDRANVDIGDIAWTYYTSGVNPIFYGTLSDIKKIPTSDVAPNMVTTIYKTISSMARSTFARDANNCEITETVDGTTVFIRNDGYTDATTFKTAMTGQQLVYELATPITYELTALEVIATLKGSNNVWADTGSIISAQSGVDMTGATATSNGTHGFVPAPSAGDQNKALFGDGTWKTVSVEDPDDFTGATASTAGVHGLVPAPAAGDQLKILYGDGTWKSQLPTPNMRGATASTDGVHGLVPAPSAGDQNKVLTGDGTWKVSPGAKVYEKTVTVTNTSGAYSQTFTDENISADMKAVELEVNRSFVFGDSIIVTPNDGSVTVACNDVAGTDTIKISLIKVIDDPTAVTSTEFTILNNRIGDLESLETTDKTSMVNAVNEVVGNVSDNAQAIADLDDRINTLDSVQTPTAPTINTTTVASGTVRCVIKDGWAFLSVENIVFKAAGNAQSIITGCPKAALQTNGKYGGATASDTAAIDAAGDTLWINRNGTNISTHLGSTYGRGHWFSIAYPIADS